MSCGMLLSYYIMQKTSKNLQKFLKEEKKRKIK